METLTDGSSTMEITMASAATRKKTSTQVDRRTNGPPVLEIVLAQTLALALENILTAVLHETLKMYFLALSSETPRGTDRRSINSKAS